MLKSLRTLLVVSAVAEELLLELFAHEPPPPIAAKHLRGDAVPDVSGAHGGLGSQRWSVPDHLC
eukprot:483951-Rhodomonas_salina.1